MTEAWQIIHRAHVLSVIGFIGFAADVRLEEEVGSQRGDAVW
jgi:hypothetical protein